ncbi:4Fe-4S single cluster domain-containing protein [Ethanoligenens harbinense]|uniref:Radical SAM domain-containing protein n=1 Tax=Ethanoligenens harbinense (strain DSM 18485 / JCM 12961 / CGMCC 1.5033 / YUAN-3) TaxID=663278 RepID=E6U3U5_ETHHY|nr:4Fe-4S single cluster domain-containing protein [Ethanoligenens harbinense]ADU26512.1 radical SAM domain-containing protein [Ethanoligenens harbinense YUAN-3]
MNNQSLWLACIDKESDVNGTGRRCVIWTQGCSLHCAGCFNPGLHVFHKGAAYNPKSLAQWLAGLENNGVTISGGEPLDQNAAVYQFIRTYRNFCNHTVFLFTGYSLEEIKRSPKRLRTVLATDAVLCGRYRPGPKWSNKQLLLITNRISADDLKPVNDIELSISDGVVFMTGYPNL